MRSIRALLPAIALGAISAHAAPRVQFLHPGDVSGDCGCYFSVRGAEATDQTKLVVAWSFDEPAHMRVDGLRYTLRVAERKNYYPKVLPGRVGHQQTTDLRGKGIDAILRTAIVRAVDPAVEHCESELLDGTITIRTKSGTTTLAVTGTCGC